MTTLPFSNASTIKAAHDNNRKPVTLNSVTTQNKVSTVLLSDVPIVALNIDGKERLCLAQISTTLLKRYSYNEIHNRRVALGITCVQCTPVQLEILRRAGAMPISSRRCGMISKREAERLVKSFLEDARPPKLPEHFSFDVVHHCGWGATGKFTPARYNSSRAKCIKCDICNLYFSPNKFIFHYHRLPDSKYQHPDAANFNSWRRHLYLSKSETEEIVHAWEDVKAMFNGGSRKRIITSMHTKSIEPKIAKFDKNDAIGPYYPPVFPTHPYSFKTMPSPYLPMPFDRPLSPFNVKTQLWSIPAPEFTAYNEPLWVEAAETHPSSRGISPRLSPDSRTRLHSVSTTRGLDSNASGSRDETLSAFTPVEKTVVESRRQLEDSDDSRKTDDTDEHDEDSDIDIMDDGADDETEPERTPDVQEPSRSETTKSATVNAAENEAEVTSSCVGKQETETQIERTRGSEQNQEHEHRAGVCNKKMDELETIITQDDFMRVIQRESEARRQLEMECQTIKENLYRELDLERKTRFALQQKLKEAHDALHNFSCRMLTARQCECSYRDAVR